MTSHQVGGTTEPRIALLTGATDGIGKASAGLLRRAGWRVVITARSAERANAALRDINATSGAFPAKAVYGDLSLMQGVTAVAAGFRVSDSTLDFLSLNANHIARTRQLTREGLEANVAIGHRRRIDG